AGYRTMVEKFDRCAGMLDTHPHWRKSNELSNMPVSSSNWESYPWKNELSLQLDRVLAHCAEIVDEDFAGPYNPHHMLERALVLCAFCVRRMVEKRLVTDKFAMTKLEVRTFQ